MNAEDMKEYHREIRRIDRRKNIMIGALVLWFILFGLLPVAVKLLHITEETKTCGENHRTVTITYCIPLSEGE